MKKLFSHKLLIVSLCLSVLLASAGTSMANTSLPFMTKDLNSSFTNARWVILSYLLASTAFSFFAGRLGDSKGNRKILLIGTLVYVVGSSACGYANSLNTLIFARLIQGLGAAVLMSLPVALAAIHAPTDKTAQTIGLLATMSAIGTTLGPSLGGFILATQNWRATFFYFKYSWSFKFFSFIDLYSKNTNIESYTKKSHAPIYFTSRNFL